MGLERTERRAAGMETSLQATSVNQASLARIYPHTHTHTHIVTHGHSTQSPCSPTTFAFKWRQTPPPQRHVPQSFNQKSCLHLIQSTAKCSRKLFYSSLFLSSSHRHTWSTHTHKHPLHITYTTDQSFF